MPAKCWATEEETLFLASLRPSFLEHQKCHDIPKFWPPLYAEYFKKFPECVKLFGADITDEALSEDQRVVLGEAIKKRQSQIKMWFNWCHPNNGRKVERASSTTLTNLATKPKHHFLKVHEEYSQMFYEDRIKTHVDAAKMIKKLTQKEALKLVNRITIQWFETEDDWVKQKVLDAIEARKKAAGEKCVDEEDGMEISPSQYQE
ncbi:hypothetical protein BKA93DRAFT_831199 [Sparassis latifolia]